MRVLRADGFEAESAIPYAALQRLMIPLRDYLRRAARAAPAALRVAAGVADGPPPDRFLVGLGVLGLLAAAGEDRPVRLCGRRRPPGSTPSRSTRWRSSPAGSRPRRPPGLRRAASGACRAGWPGVPSSESPASHPDAAVACCVSAAGADRPGGAAQIADATGGNPLALIDLAQSSSASTRLAESSLADEPVPVGRHLEDALPAPGASLAAEDAAVAAGGRRRLHRRPAT